jgi:hypothetical protein
MIVRGLLRFARGDKGGISEFDGTLEGFATSLVPLIAFPLVFSGSVILSGEWRVGVLAFLSSVCMVLVVPVIIYEVAKRTGREALWLRTATALDWSFLMFVPLLAGAICAAAVAAAAGLPLQDDFAVILGMMGGYMLWYHWLILRAGRGLSGWQAAWLVAGSSLIVGLLSIGPMLIEGLNKGL